jgi:hypothetical protein
VQILPIIKAAVIVPPLSDFYFTPHRFSVLGAHVVTRLLTTAGIHTELLNFPLMNPRGSAMPLPEKLDHLKPYFIENERGRASFFTSFRRFGPSIDVCVQHVRKLEPDICFLSLFAFCYADDALALAAALRQQLPDIPVVIGGSGASVHPQYFMRSGHFDFVLTGEAEVNLMGFLRAMPGQDWLKTDGLFWREQGEIRSSCLKRFACKSEIETPFVKTSANSRTDTFSVSLSRGCPKTCDFCTSRLLFGSAMRTVELQRLDNQCAELAKQQQLSNKKLVINIEDDNLFSDEILCTSVMSTFRRHIPGVEFIAENGIDYSALSPDLCEWLIMHGMRKFNFSIASLDRDILQKQRRFIDLDRYELCLNILAGKNVPNVTYFICGFKDDTPETVANNLAYLARQRTLVGISLFYPVPGLPGFSDLSLFDGGQPVRCLGSSAFPWNHSLSTETMITAFRLSRYINLTKSTRRSPAEDRLVAQIECEKSLFTFVTNQSGREEILPVKNQDSDLVELYFDKAERYC